MVKPLKRQQFMSFRSTRRFATDRNGVSAVEFALILPLMLGLYLGGVEFGDAFSIKRKVTRVTSSLGDLVTQSKTISDTDMSHILDAAESVVAPYPSNLLQMKVTGISIDQNGVGRVAWSDARNDTPHAKDSVIAVPSSLQLANSFLVTAEITYEYTPTIGYKLTGSIDLSDQFFLRPRRSAEVNRVIAQQ